MEKRRNFVNYATMTLADGTVLNLQPSDFRINGNEFTDDLVDGEDFQVGTALGKTVTIRLDNVDDRFSSYDFYMAYFYLYIHLPDAYEDGSGNLQDGIFQIGKFTVIEPSTTGTVIDISGVDDMYKFDQSFDNCTLDFSTRPTLGQILRRCCADCGVTVGFVAFDNDSIQVSERPIGVTYREVVSYICQIAGVNAKISASGAFELMWYDMSIFDSIGIDGGTYNPWNTGDVADGGSFNPWSVGDVADSGTFDTQMNFHQLYNIKGLSVSTDDIEFTGVSVISEDNTVTVGTNDYVLVIQDNPFTYGKETIIANFLYNKLNGFKFRPFSCTHLQDPTMEAGDIALLWDIKGNLYKTVITNITFSTSSFMSLSCNAKSPTKQKSTYKNPAAQAVAASRRYTDQAVDSYASAVDHFNELATNSLGYFRTDQVEQGATITYLHDQATLAGSTYIVKITGSGVFISEDGGQSYTSGYDTTTATLLINLLYVQGITAGFIQDKAGNFYLDLDNGTLQMKSSAIIQDGQDSTTLSAMLSSISSTAEGLSSEIIRATTAESKLNGSYSGSYTPTTSNLPASGWNTTELKEQHLNDIFINTQTGDTYMWKKSKGGVMLTFDAQSATESPSFDYVRVYYYDSSTGTYKYTKDYGGNGSNNTISGLRLFVPSNTFYVYWRTDSSVVNWGFKIDKCEAAAYDKDEIASLYPNSTSSLPISVTTTLNGISTMPETAHNYPNSQQLLWQWNTQVTIPTGDYNWCIQSSISAAYSQIKQTADQISLKVSKGDVSSQLSVESGQITLASGRLVISTGNFQLNSNGIMTCNGANITGNITVGGSGNTNGSITVLNSSENTAAYIDNTGFTGYGQDINNYYTYRARFGVNGYVRYGKSSSRYNFNIFELFSSYSSDTFAYLGIDGNTSTPYPNLRLVNKHGNIYIPCDDGVVQLESNTYYSDVSDNYSNYYYDRQAYIKVDPRDGGMNSLAEARKRSRIVFSTTNTEYDSSGNVRNTYSGYQYIDRLGFHGNVYGDLHGGDLYAEDVHTYDWSGNEKTGYTMPNDGDWFRIRVYSGGSSSYTAGYYKVQIWHGLITNIEMD